MDTLLIFARLLADETRQSIMKLLCCRELSVNDLVNELAAEGKQLTQPTVSHHLSELYKAGFVLLHKQGRQSFYTLNQQQVTVCCGEIMANFAPNVTFNTET